MHATQFSGICLLPHDTTISILEMENKKIIQMIIQNKNLKFYPLYPHHCFISCNEAMHNPKDLKKVAENITRCSILSPKFSSGFVYRPVQIEGASVSSFPKEIVEKITPLHLFQPSSSTTNFQDNSLCDIDKKSGAKKSNSEVQENSVAKSHTFHGEILQSIPPGIVLGYVQENTTENQDSFWNSFFSRQETVFPMQDYNLRVFRLCKGTYTVEETNPSPVYWSFSWCQWVKLKTRDGTK